MLRNSLFIMLFGLFMVACSDDKPIGDYVAVGVSEELATEQDPSAPTKSFEEEQYNERVSYSLQLVQQEFNKSQGKVKGQGDVTVYVDQNFNLLLKHKYKGDDYETRVNLTDLNIDNTGMTLIIDQNPGDNPGVRCFTIDLKPKVKNYKNGELVSETDHLDIILGSRKNVEDMLPGWVQAIRTALEKS